MRRRDVLRLGAVGSGKHGGTRQIVIASKIDPPQRSRKDQAQNRCQDEAQVKYRTSRPNSNNRLTESYQKQ